MLRRPHFFQRRVTIIRKTHPQQLASKTTCTRSPKMDATKNTAGQTEKKTQDAAQGVKDGFKATFEDHKANPGPAMPQEFNVKEEGTKEERRAKAAELNK